MHYNASWDTRATSIKANKHETLIIRVNGQKEQTATETQLLAVKKISPRRIGTLSNIFPICKMFISNKTTKLSINSKQNSCVLLKKNYCCNVTTTYRQC